MLPALRRFPVQKHTFSTMVCNVSDFPITIHATAFSARIFWRSSLPRRGDRHGDHDEISFPLGERVGCARVNGDHVDAFKVLFGVESYLGSSSGFVMIFGRKSPLYISKAV